MGKTFKLQKGVLKTEMNHNEVHSDTWRDKKSGWLDYVENDVIRTSFSYAWYTKAMEEITVFGMKDCLSLPGLGWTYFNCLITGGDEPIYTYNEKYMRYFLQRSVRRGRVCAFNQNYKSKISDDILKIISEELNAKGNFYDIIEAYLDYKNK